MGSRQRMADDPYTSCFLGRAEYSLKWELISTTFSKNTEHYFIEDRAPQIQLSFVSTFSLVHNFLDGWVER